MSAWEPVKLGDILRLKVGKRPKYCESGTIPVYGANGIIGYTTEHLTDNDYTLIIGRVGSAGKVNLGQGKIWVSDNAFYSVSYDSSKVYLPFLFYALQFKNLERWAYGSVQPYITLGTLYRYITVELPKLEEQLKIANNLA